MNNSVGVSSDLGSERFRECITIARFRGVYIVHSKQTAFAHHLHVWVDQLTYIYVYIYTYQATSSLYDDWNTGKTLLQNRKVSGKM